MAIHILNCVTMSPLLPRWKIGGVCLLAETDEGPILIDTGLGLQDYAHPSRLLRFLRPFLGIPKNPEQSAVRQVARVGWQPEKVRHILLTHLHFDHAGGLADFPHAWVHVYQPEYAAMRKPRSLLDRLGYDPSNFRHGPKWVFHDEINARWFDFDAIRLDFQPEIYLIPLPGHTRGNCGIAIRDAAGWLFQCGGALPVNARLDRRREWLTRPFRGQYTARLEAFAAGHPNVRLLAGHMDLDWFEANSR